MSFPLGWQRKYRFLTITYLQFPLNLGGAYRLCPSRGLGWADSSSAIKPCESTGLHPYAYNFAINSRPHLLWNCKGTTFCPGEHNRKCKCEETQPLPSQNCLSEAGNFFHCCSKWAVLCLETGRVQVWARGRRLSLAMRSCCSEWWNWASESTAEESSRNLNRGCCNKMGKDPI